MSYLFYSLHLSSSLSPPLLLSLTNIEHHYLLQQTTFRHFSPSSPLSPTISHCNSPHRTPSPTPTNYFPPLLPFPSLFLSPPLSPTISHCNSPHRTPSPTPTNYCPPPKPWAIPENATPKRSSKKLPAWRPELLNS